MRVAQIYGLRQQRWSLLIPSKTDHIKSRKALAFRRPIDTLVLVDSAQEPPDFGLCCGFMVRRNLKGRQFGLPSPPTCGMPPQSMEKQG